ncbi:hypothetical protein CXG81DRAFT_5129, partial [Caulochytrium protostelioides]
PCREDYLRQIREAQQWIHDGHTYECCVTAPTLIHTTSSSFVSDLRQFARLRESNPAAYMAYMQLGPLTVLSCSPELFLAFDAAAGTCVMKPIKGTLPRTDGEGRPIDAETAQQALHTTKVLAENLMIVDLIRHDLARLATEVTAPCLMHV